MDAVADSVKQLFTVRPLKFHLPFPSKANSNFNFKVWHPRCVLIQCIKSG